MGYRLGPPDQRRLIDLDQLFSRTVAMENSNGCFSRVKMIGEKLDQPGISLAVPGRRVD